MYILFTICCLIAAVTGAYWLILWIEQKQRERKLFRKIKSSQYTPLLANFRIPPDELAKLRKTLPTDTKSGTYLTVQALYTAVNNCMIAIEATGLTLEEALVIPGQLEKAIIYASSQQLHKTRFTAFQITREPDGQGGWKEEPEGYANFSPKP